MILSVGPSPEFIKFIQILCWIVLPILLAAWSFTVFTHYRNKKAASKKTVHSEADFIEATPEQVGYTKGDGEYVLFDHSRLIQEYKDRLSYNHARFVALQKDYTSIEIKFSALVNFTQSLFLTHKTDRMEKLQQQLPSFVREEINTITAATAAEKEALVASLEHMDRTRLALEEENKWLKEQLEIQAMPSDEAAIMIKKWQEEHDALRSKIASQEYMADLLDEKTAQVVFLQGQLEQRIKNQHHAGKLRFEM